MIRINLLDYRKERIRAKIQMQIAIALVLVVLDLGLAGFLSSFQGSKMADLDGQIKQKNVELDALKDVEAKVAESEKMQKRLEDIVNTIDGLKKKQKEPARLYHEILNKRMPAGEVWLEKVTEMPDRIVLEGNAFRDSAISAFMESLEKMDAFPDVSLEFVRQKEVEKRKIKNFKINCILTTEGLYADRKWTKSKPGEVYGMGGTASNMPKGGIYGMGGTVEHALSRQGAFEYGQQLQSDLKDIPRNPFVESRNRAREKSKQEQK